MNAKEVKINGRTVDVSKAVPLTLRDWKNLKDKGVDLFKGGQTGLAIEQVAVVTFYVLAKADPTVTEDEVWDLPMPVINQVSAAAFGGEEAANRPT